MVGAVRQRTRWEQASRSPWLLAAGLVFVGILYFSTLSVNHTEAEDSLWFLKSIANDRLIDQFHPNELLYKPINSLFFRAWKLVGYGGTVELPVKVLNIAAALAALGLIYAIACHLRFPPILRYFALLGTAFAYGFWWYSVECETYVPPLSFILLALHRLLLIRQEPLQRSHHVWLGLFTAAAVLMHQQHTLLAFVVLAGYGLIFLERRHDIAWRQFLPRVVLWGVLCAGVVATVYLLVAVVAWQLRTPAEIARWLTYNANPGGHGYGLSLSSLKGGIGAGRALIGGLFLFAFPMVTGFIRKAVPNYDLKEEMFLVKDLPRVEGLLLTGLLLLLIALMVVAALTLLRQRRLTSAATAEVAGRRFFLRLLAVYLGVYILFNLWWQPENLEMWISLIPVTFLAFGVLAVPLAGRRRFQIGLGLFLTCLLGVNLFGSILPQTDLSHDYWYAYNAWLIGNTGPDDLVVSGEDYSGDSYIAFYSGAKVLATSTALDPEGQFEWMVRRYQPKRIFFSSSMLAPFQRRGQPTESIELAARFFARVEPDLTLVHSDEWQKIYLYRPR